MTPAPITALIVDDEPLGRDLVRNMLAAHPDVNVLAECADGEKAQAAIRQFAPQVVFLDVKMPRLDGVGLLRRLPAENRPLIVFITAHDSYALHAFEGQALDYLLKPFDQERFDTTLGRVRARLAQIAAARIGETVRDMVAATAPPAAPAGPPVERLVVRDPGRIHFVNVRDIAWLEASGNYVAVHTPGAKTHLIHETMASIESRLPAGFVRIHRSTIVNVACIRQLEPHLNGEFIVVLDDNVRLKLSRSYAESARRLLGLA